MPHRYVSNKTGFEEKQHGNMGLAVKTLPLLPIIPCTFYDTNMQPSQAA